MQIRVYICNKSFQDSTFSLVSSLLGKHLLDKKVLVVGDKDQLSRLNSLLWSRNDFLPHCMVDDIADKSVGDLDDFDITFDDAKVILSEKFLHEKSFDYLILFNKLDLETIEKSKSAGFNIIIVSDNEEHIPDLDHKLSRQDHSGKWN